MLLFKKKFLPAIRAGEKTQTIRLWPFARMRAGQRSYIPGVGYIQIDAVEPVELEALGDADAQLDGFATANALRDEIRQIYAEKPAANYRAFRVTFHALGPGHSQQKKVKVPKAAANRRSRKRKSPGPSS
ncbi:MAG: ASCH domain-containing protein [Pirellulales bacterium]